MHICKKIAPKGDFLYRRGGCVNLVSHLGVVLYSIAADDQQAVAEDLLSSHIIQACWINNLKDRF